MATITQVQTKVQTKDTVVTTKLYPLETVDVNREEELSQDLPDIPLPPPSKKPTEVLRIDKDTPDGHVPRDPRLIRLTGVHPFNVEPPLTDLFNDGKATVLSIAQV